MIKVGIIGNGRMAEIRANALKEIPGAQLWSVGGRDINHVQEFARKHQAAAEKNAFDDLQAMLNDSQLDAVIIATPSHVHDQQILMAAKAGKDIFVEKLVCTSLDSKNELLTACRESGVTLTVGYNLRWHEGLRKIATTAHSNALGEIRHLRLHWTGDLFGHQWKVGPNQGKWLCLTAMGTHVLDIVRWIMLPLCGEVVEIKSFIKKIKVENEFDGAVLVILRFESGATAEIFCSILFDSPFNLEIYASKKNIIATDLVNQTKPGKILIGDENVLFSMSNPYLMELKGFIQSVTEKTPPEVPLDEGLKNLETLFTIWNQNQG